MIRETLQPTAFPVEALGRRFGACPKVGLGIIARSCFSRASRFEDPGRFGLNNLALFNDLVVTAGLSPAALHASPCTWPRLAPPPVQALAVGSRALDPSSLLTLLLALPADMKGLTWSAHASQGKSSKLLKLLSTAPSPSSISPKKRYCFLALSPQHLQHSSLPLPKSQTQSHRAT